MGVNSHGRHSAVPDHGNNVSISTVKERIETGGHRIIITGPVQSGKSSLVWSLVEKLDSLSIPMGGFMAKGLWENDLRAGFDLVDLQTRMVTPLARRKKDLPAHEALDRGSMDKQMPYLFFETGWATGMASLHPDICGQAEVIVVDEVGKLELVGHGWAPALSQLMKLKKPVHLWIVRDFLLDGVQRRWPFETDDVVNIDAPHALDRLLEILEKKAEKLIKE